MFRCSRVRQITKDEHRGVWNKKGRAIHFFKWKIDEQYYYRLHSLFCPHGHHAVVVKDFFLPNLALSMQITTEPHTNTKHVIVKDKNNLKKKEINIYIFVITSSNTLKESVISVIINNYWSIDFWFSSLIRNFFFFFHETRYRATKHDNDRYIYHFILGVIGPLIVLGSSIAILSLVVDYRAIINSNHTVSIVDTKKKKRTHVTLHTYKPLKSVSLYVHIYRYYVCRRHIMRKLRFRPFAHIMSNCILSVFWA